MTKPLLLQRRLRQRGGCGVQGYHCDFENEPSQWEIFEVDDEFYTRNILGCKPEGATSLGCIKREFEPLTVENIADKLDK